VGVTQTGEDDAIATRALDGVSTLNLSLDRLDISVEPFPKLTHYLFRFPAKFHPPVVQTLLDRYTKPGDLILDPFCGSGTLLVEAAIAGRPSVGFDVDPLSVLVANAKVSRFQSKSLQSNSKTLVASLQEARRPGADYKRLMKEDLSDAQYDAELQDVAQHVPAIPNLLHWFRRYVVVDLAHIRRSIDSLACSANHQQFFRVVFASIIRRASNADPVPISGLEYTAHMRQRDADGRLVDPFSLFETALQRAVEAVSSFTSASSRSGAHAKAFIGDATELTSHMTTPVDAVITSPPYHGAVDYYRRHQLEHFWLGLTETQGDRLGLLSQYVGRPKVPQRDRFVLDGVLTTALAKEWESRIREVAADRANAFKHYLVAMKKTFDGLASTIRIGGPVVMIVGHSSWNSSQIPTAQLFAEISQEWFDLEALLWYPVKNRYMSYSRHNDANIETEYVLVLRRK
jgi:hypothetical protein